MDYFQKYLKYKSKYLDLKMKGGYKPDTNTLDEMQKYVSNGTFTIHDFIISQYYDILQTFFNNIKNKDYLYLVPENFDNFFGKTLYNDTDIEKIWSRLNDQISSGNTYTLINDLYLGGIIPITKILIIPKKSKDVIADVFKNIFSKFYNPADKNLINIKEREGGKKDQTQLTGISEGPFRIYPEFKQEALKRINNYKSSDLMKDFSGNFTMGSKNYNYKYYNDKNILYVYIDTPNNNLELYMFNVEITETNYKIFPYTYNNLLLNDKYENSIKTLFTDITSTLNNINSTTEYKILPDGFFHIHVTIPDNQSKYVLLTIHALYEIVTNDTDITYTYNGENRTRRNIDFLNVFDLRKKHSFYLLFDTDNNTHKLYQINSSNLDLFFNNKIEIGINERILGNNIIDINHIDGKGVIITKTNQECNSLCQPKCPNGKPECKPITLNKINYYFKDEGNNNFILINNEGDKCASIIILDNFNKFGIQLLEKNIFIDDIKTNIEYQNCKTKFTDINTLISNFGRLKGINYITLDDGAFIQFPEKYSNIADAPYNWTYVYLQQRYDMNNNLLTNLNGPYTFQPIKHSIYSCREGYELIKPLDPVDPKYIEINMIEKYLDFCVAYYNTYKNTLNYNLLTHTNDLSTRYNNHRKGIPDADLTSDTEKYRNEYAKFKNFIDAEITYFAHAVYNDTDQFSEKRHAIENINELSDHFKTDDYHNLSETKQTFTIHYKNYPEYSITINKLDPNTDLIVNSSSNIYDFLLNKNMTSYFKRI
jgi:hypothetical protein